MKKEIRVIGIDDAPFDKKKKTDVLIIGTIFRGGDFLDGVVSTKIRVDGNNSTKKVIDLINNCKFKPQLQAIFLDGIAFGGFNVVDIEEINEQTKIPVIVVVRNMPNLEKIKKALENVKGGDKKFELIKKAGKIIKVGDIHCQLKGISEEKAKQIIKICATRSNLPEAIRVAHITARGITTGESRGKA